MSEEDDYRVEARLAGASRGVSPTTEQIQTLLERQRSHEKLTRPPPQKAFSQVMGEQGGKQQDAEDPASPQPDEPPTSPQSDAAPKAAAALERAATPPPLKSPPAVDTFVRRTLPAGFQRSGRTQAPPAALSAAAPTPLPDGPQARQVETGERAPRPKGKKIIIRG